ILRKSYLASLDVGTASLTFQFTAGADQTLNIDVIEEPSTSPYGLYGFGDNYSGQLGQGPVERNNVPVKIKKVLAQLDIHSIAAGVEHTLVLTTDGNVYAFGEGSEGQLGQGNTDSHYWPVEVTGLPP